MPDFQQFADECIKRLTDESLAIGDPEVLRTSERHARLLQQIWEWAHEPTRLTIVGDGEAASKIHVRSLLVGQQEAK